jgi:hypothetical protein
MNVITSFAEDIAHLRHLLEDTTDVYLKDRIRKQIELLEETEEKYNRARKKDLECQNNNTI